jgi:activated CDC42 kinase 1
MIIFWKICFVKIIKSKKEDCSAMAVLLPEDGNKDRAYPLKVPSKHIIPAEAIVVNKELGVGEFGVVQQGVWTNEDGDRVCILAYYISEVHKSNIG